MASVGFRRMLVPVVLMAGVLCSPLPSAAAELLSFVRIEQFAGCGTADTKGYIGDILGFFALDIDRQSDKVGLPTGPWTRSLKLVKGVDACTPPLLLAILGGQELTIQGDFARVEQGEGVPLTRISATRVLATNSSIATSGGAVSEVVAFAIRGQLTVTFFRYDAQGQSLGSVSTCWNFATGSSC